MSRLAVERIRSVRISRIQSSSSISTYRQCPRKYYYHYILKIPSKPSIHLIRGSIAHKIVEDFFRININNISEKDFEFSMKILLQDQLRQLWDSSDFSLLEMSDSDLRSYLLETQEMIENWFYDLLKRVKADSEKIGFKEAFRLNTPVAEEHFISKKMGVQGFVDAIFKNKDEIKIIDYKTSKKDMITDDYRLQLAIYSLLYHEKYGVYPDKVGLFLFRHGERVIDVDDDLLEYARSELVAIHKNTQSKEIALYPMNKTRLCDWGKGRCDYYDMCFGNSCSSEIQTKLGQD